MISGNCSPSMSRCCDRSDSILMPKYEAILFDFDGVLVDSEPIHFSCWQEVLDSVRNRSQTGKHYSEHCIGITDRAMLAFLCSRNDPPADIEALAAEYPRKKDIFRERMSTIGIAEEIRELVQELRAEYRVGVVSSSNIREVGRPRGAGLCRCSTRWSMAAR